MRLVARWVPGRAIAWGTDSRVAALELLDTVKALRRGRVRTRRRLAAALSAPPPPRAPRTIGRPRRTGKRQPTLEAVLADERTPWTPWRVAQWDGDGLRAVEVATDPAGWSHTGNPPVALRGVLLRTPQECGTPPAGLSTNGAPAPAQRLPWFVRRWTMAGTLAEARAPLGLATQRPGNARALARTTPALLRRYTVITLTAPRLIEPGATCVRWPAGSRNTRPPCADAIALVRRQLWEQIHGSPSLQDTDMLHMPRALFARFVETVCYAA